jgi:hypothetical protein
VGEGADGAVRGLAQLDVGVGAVTIAVAGGGDGDDTRLAGLEVDLAANIGELEARGLADREGFRSFQGTGVHGGLR